MHAGLHLESLSTIIRYPLAVTVQGMLYPTCPWEMQKSQGRHSCYLHADLFLNISSNMRKGQRQAFFFNFFCLHFISQFHEIICILRENLYMVLIRWNSSCLKWVFSYFLPWELAPCCKYTDFRVSGMYFSVCACLIDSIYHTDPLVVYFWVLLET